MALLYLSLLTVIPALLILWVGMWLSAMFTTGSSKRVWLLFLLLGSMMILIPGSFYAERFSDGNFPIFLLLLFPTLEGVLALLLIQWREVVSVWQNQKTLVSVLLLVLLLLMLSLARYPGTGLAPAVVVLPAVLAAVVWAVVTRLSLNMLYLGALIGTMYLFIDATGAPATSAVMNTPWMLAVYQATELIVKVIAIAISILLIHRGTSGEHKYARIPAVLLLLGLAAVEVRHGLLVEATGRATEDHFPFGSLVLVLVGGMLLAGATEGRGRLAGFSFMVLVPALIITAYISGSLFDPLVITENRAGRLAQAIEEYKAENGEYPPDLESLTPSPLPLLLGPLNGRGRGWCYQAGGDYYRLGFVFFQRYYETTYPTPYYEIKVPYSAGEFPPGPWMCDDALSRYQESPGL